MEKINKEILEIFIKLYKKFPEALRINTPINNLTREQTIGLLRFLSEEGYIRVSGAYPSYLLSLTGKGYLFIHNFLKRTNNHNELLIIYQEV